MSEYMDRFSVSRLVGAPPGYVGYEEGGQLTGAVRRKPHSVILFDEMEKAHEDVLNILLQILDEGQLTDGKGRTVNFKNAVVVMTSNVGSQRILEEAVAADETSENSRISDVVKEELEKKLRPELLNRIDDIITFRPLSFDNLKDICLNLVAKTVERAAEEQKMDIVVSDNIPEVITRETASVSRRFGARPVRRAVQKYLEDPIAEAIMREFIQEGDTVKVDIASTSETKKIRVTNTSLNGDGNSITVDLDDETTGIGSSKADEQYDLLYGPAISLGSDDDDDNGGDGKPGEAQKPQIQPEPDAWQ